jgi:hypothetical protein
MRPAAWFHRRLMLLSQIRCRLPYVIAAVGMLANLLSLILPRVPETLPRSLRKNKKVGRGWLMLLRDSSPLSAVKLFTRGPRLRMFALLGLISCLGGELALWNIASVHRMQITKWDTRSRGLFDSCVLQCMPILLHAQLVSTAVMVRADPTGSRRCSLLPVSRSLVRCCDCLATCARCS